MPKNLAFIKKTDYVKKLINSMPYIGVILNKHRQMMFANFRSFEIVNLIVAGIIPGQPPGKILYCVNAEGEFGFA